MTLNEWNTYTLSKLPRNITKSSHILLPSPNSSPSSLDHFSLFFALDFIFSRGNISAQPNKFSFCIVTGVPLNPTHDFSPTDLL
ncbi:hypothetical protein NC651_033705 [Populus alba x Populus x berolinensis]|nr:hypothetical protein NC651_033705 [Populus alba x Populus x berolinensis]